LLLANKISRRERMQTCQCLQWRPLPHPNKSGGTAFKRLADPQCSGEHRVAGHRGGVEDSTATVEHRG
jgi:hypothetical protein